MPQLGTGHAVQQAVPHLRDDGTAVVLSGDVPLTQADTLRALVAASGGERLALLGGELNNSSASNLAYLDKLWPTLKAAELNTVLAPVEWDQIEPVEGRFDFTVLDGMLKQARAHDTRLVLLWFGTWKNTGPNYAPEWVKFNNTRFPRMVAKDGKITYCLSPQGEETLKADKKAFVELMRHIKKIDEAQRTVIMVQVENEVGTYGYARDYAPKAEALFNQPVPQAVLDYKKSPVPLAKSGSWKQVYGDYADEYFHAWAIARYIGEIAAAGRAMGMSYKRAWDLVDEINRICRQAAVERQTGGKNGGGAVLTPFGLSLVARYRKIERDAASAVRKELEALRSDIGKPKKAVGR